jgi:hypothetical protein
LEFDQSVPREGVDADRGADVFAVIAEDLNKEVRSSVDDCGRTVEAGDAIDVAIHRDDFGDGIK